MNEVEVFTDGSAIGNPGPGGWAVIEYRDNQVAEYAGRAAHTTNNRMELTAVIEALSRTKNDPRPLTVHADSQYVLRGAQEWLPRWQANGWRTAAKQPVINQDLWEIIADLTHNRQITWRHVRGHAGHAENERADQLANAQARGEHLECFSGPRGEYSLSSGSDAVRYVSFVEGVPQTHATWQECEGRVRGVPGARFKKVSSEAAARETVRAWQGHA